MHTSPSRISGITEFLTRHHTLIGAYLLTWWFLDILLTIRYDHLFQLLWFCDFIFPLVGVAFIYGSSMIATGVLSGALVAQTPWVVDFLTSRITGTPLLGLTSYMSQYGHGLRFWVEMNHLVIIPASILAVAAFGVSRHGHIVSWGVGGLMLLLSSLLSNPAENVNCLQHFCWASTTSIPHFPLVFSIGVLSLISLMNLTLFHFFGSPKKTSF